MNPDDSGVGQGGGVYLENAGDVHTNGRGEVEQAQDNTG